MKSAVTVSLVPEARGGPFVFWDDLPQACRTAQSLGFDAIELFAPGPDEVPANELTKILSDHGLSLAAVGTGGGWVRHRLTLTSSDASVRQKAIDFIRSMIDYGAALNAPAIIGSMQGKWGEGTDSVSGLGYLIEALTILSPSQGMLIYEPLNRYETNLVNRLDDGVKLLKTLGVTNVKLLADLFHMNIEEADLAASIRAAGSAIGHVHLADSNRWPASYGHTNFKPIGDTLREIGYAGYISAEAFPRPTSILAAEATIQSFRQHFQSGLKATP